MAVVICAYYKSPQNLYPACNQLVIIPTRSFSFPLDVMAFQASLIELLFVFGQDVVETELLTARHDEPGNEHP